MTAAKEKTFSFFAFSIQITGSVQREIFQGTGL